jgi:type I restriction enzyme S subunit
MELEEYTFKELLSRIVDNRGKTCPTAETGTALIATNCIKDDQLYPVFEKVRWVDSETMQTWFRGHPEPGDILFVLKGSPGRCCLVPDPINFCIAQDMLALRADESKVSQKFLFALLRSSIVKSAIENLHVGTMIPHFKKGDFDQLAFQIPKSRTIQDRIGDIYFMLSNKIELNRRMNETLEGIAQALFKSWFVDFDPVIDNALEAGNPIPEEFAARAETRRKALSDQQAGLADGTANREAAKNFPATFELSDELGWIPAGWVAMSFKSFTSAKTERVEDRDVPEYSSTNEGLFPRADRFKKQLSKSKSKNKLIRSGDLVFGMSRKVLNFGLMHQKVGSVSSAYHVFEIDQSRIFPEFVESYIRARPGYYYGILGSSSREGQSLSKSSFNLTSMLIPSDEIQEDFKRLRTDLVSKKIFNSSQSDCLTKLRDTLLPKLISGELRIEDAEKM